MTPARRGGGDHATGRRHDGITERCMRIVAELKLLNGEQRAAFAASFLGWTLDAFDFAQLAFARKLGFQVRSRRRSALTVTIERQVGTADQEPLAPTSGDRSRISWRLRPTAWRHGRHAQLAHSGAAVSLQGHGSQQFATRAPAAASLRTYPQTIVGTPLRL